MNNSDSSGDGLLLPKPEDDFAVFISVQDGPWDDPTTWGQVKYPGPLDVVFVYHTVEVTGNFMVFNVHTVTVFGFNNGFTAELKVTGGATLNAINIEVSFLDSNNDGLLRVTGTTRPGTLNVSANLVFTRGPSTDTGKIRMEMSGNATAHIAGDITFFYNDADAGETAAEIFIQDNSQLEVVGDVYFRLLGGGRAGMTVQETATATVGNLVFDLEGDATPTHDGILTLQVLDDGEVNVLGDITLNSFTSLNNTVYGNDIIISMNGANSYLGVAGNFLMTNYGNVPKAKNIIVNLFESSIFEVQGNFTAVNASTTPQGFFAPDVDANLFQDSQLIIHGNLILQQQTPNANILEITLNNNAQLLAEGNIVLDAESLNGCKITLLNDSRLEMAGGLILQNSISADAVNSADNATIEYRGTTTQTIKIPKYVNLELNNTSNVLNHAYDMATNISISGVISFFEGIVLTGDLYTVTLADNGTVAGTPDNERHVNGFFQKLGSTDFEFPIGINGEYRPFYAENISVSAKPGIRVRYYNKTPSAICAICDEALKEESLSKVSRKEVWTVDTNDIVNFRPRITWADISDVSSIEEDRLELVVTVWGGPFNQWLDGGQGAIVDNGEFDGNVLGSSVTIADVGTSTLVTFGSREGGNPLPVSLLYFIEKNTANDILLEWATASEDNNDYFEIQRSFNGLSNFEVLAQVNGQGNSDDLNVYNFYDSLTANLQEARQLGGAFYRLKQVDFNGLYTFSEIISVDLRDKLDASHTLGFQISPNPINRESPNIQLTSNIMTSNTNMNGGDILEIQLIDSGGNKILAMRGTQPQIQNGISKAIKGVRQGVYFLLISSIQHNSKIKLIIL
jgi:hypothetical protein